MDDSNRFGGGRRAGLRLLPILIGAVLIGVTALRGCQEGPFGRHQIVGMDSQQEAALGAQAYAQTLSQVRLLPDGPLTEAVRQLATELIEASRRPDVVKFTGLAPPDFRWECNVVESKDINAFCLPGGKIVVYTGILPVAETDGALAAVMGHEIAHALAHHGAERMAQQQMVQIAQGAAAGAMNDMDIQQQRQIMGILGAGSKFGILLPFSRKHESEADRIGLILMAAAGYDPHEAIGFWKRMANVSQGGKPPEIMSTHPSDERRIEDLERLTSEAMPFYESAPVKRPSQPLPQLGSPSRSFRPGR